jgi:hypothetical protein
MIQRVVDYMNQYMRVLGTPMYIGEAPGSKKQKRSSLGSLEKEKKYDLAEL